MGLLSVYISTLRTTMKLGNMYYIESLTVKILGLTKLEITLKEQTLNTVKFQCYKL